MFLPNCAWSYLCLLFAAAQQERCTAPTRKEDAARLWRSEKGRPGTRRDADAGCWIDTETDSLQVPELEQAPEDRGL